METYIVIFLLLTSIIMFVLWKPSSIRVVSLLARKGLRCSRNKGAVLVLPMLVILFTGSLVIFPKTALKSAMDGAKLWALTVFPSIFPFLVISEILNGTNFINAIGIIFEPIMRPLFNVPGAASYPLILGVTSGYPVGAKAVSNIREQGLLSKEEGNRLLAFCNNSGPLFITGAIATNMLEMPNIASFLFMSHIVASFTVGLVFGLSNRFISGNRRGNQIIQPKISIYKKFKKELFSRNNYNIGTLLGNAVLNSMTTMLLIGGFIVFFSVLINLLLVSGILNGVSGMIYHLSGKTTISVDVITSVLSGFVEITTGLQLLCNFNSIPLPSKLILISIILGWGGLSVHFQVLNAIRNSDLNIRVYLLGKLFHCIFAGLFTHIGMHYIIMPPS